MVRRFLHTVLSGAAAGCRMATGARGNSHLLRTSDAQRSQVTSQATVIGVQQLSPTVKGFELKVSNPSVSFIAGQWLDVAVPGVDVVGGFSLCSAPHDLREGGTVRLAVKNSDHPPAHWMHNTCAVGASVEIRVGGDFLYDPHGNARHVLFVGGGVGINPLYSMMLHHAHLLATGLWGTGPLPQTHLLFTASCSEELLFKRELEELSSLHPIMSHTFFVTREKGASSQLPEGIQCGRITHEHYREALLKLTGESEHSSGRGGLVSSFICGPPPLIGAATNSLTALGLRDQDIHFEQWW